MSALLYKAIVHAARNCFGSSAERLISRLIIAHLNKRPEDVENEDIPELLDWAKLIMYLYTDKQQVIAQFTSEVESLQNRAAGEV